MKALQAAESKRVVDLKVSVLRRCREGELATLLMEDPITYGVVIEAGERSVMRYMRRLAA